MESARRVMALHRDIFWIGHQWAVTGAGLQAIDEKHAGRFDIAPDELWDTAPLEKLRGQIWIKADDFAKALLTAREHYAALRPGGPPIETEPDHESQPDLEPEAPPSVAAERASAPTETPEPEPAVPAAPQRPSARLMARFVGSWRVRVR